MLARVKDGRPIHRRDPLFAELFRFADRIEARYERTVRGVRVIETSQDPYVVKLIQARTIRYRRARREARIPSAGSWQTLPSRVSSRSI